MTRKYNKPKYMNKRPNKLMSRFRLAYERLNSSQRRIAQQSFCKAHHVTPGTFRNKMNGFTTLFETEVEWMEAYNPYQQSIAA